MKTFLIILILLLIPVEVNNLITPRSPCLVIELVETDDYKIFWKLFLKHGYGQVIRYEDGEVFYYNDKDQKCKFK